MTNMYSSISPFRVSWRTMEPLPRVVKSRASARRVDVELAAQLDVLPARPLPDVAERGREHDLGTAGHHGGHLRLVGVSRVARPRAGHHLVGGASEQQGAVALCVLE
jgi:hypothetical protein